MFPPADDHMSTINISSSLADGEWMLTNNLGGFAMGTLNGAHRRRYHGLLVAATNPPVGRFLVLHSLIEQLEINGKTHNLTSHFFGPEIEKHPQNGIVPEDISIQLPSELCWTYRCDDFAITRRVILLPGKNALRVEYELQQVLAKNAILRVRPLTPLRDFHELSRNSESPPEVEHKSSRTLIVQRNTCTAQLRTSRGKWIPDGQWWNQFAYSSDRDRGQDWMEDVYSPGVWEVTLGRTKRNRGAVLQAITAHPPIQIQATALDKKPLHHVADKTQQRLIAAADQFIVKRKVNRRWCASVIAGYPWFADWGRDTMIALPGLMLCTDRHDEAKLTLRTFARHLQRGLIPNCFDDRGEAAHYNSVDAALWFINATYALHQVTPVGELSDLVRACQQIIKAYREGTDFGIAMDSDGLITAGDESTQLTWMDAKRDGVTFTPRYGKAVEINALWYNALLATAAMSASRRERNTLNNLGEQVTDSFRDQFWWDEKRCLLDVLVPCDEGSDSVGACVGGGKLRPNQIFAVSLPFSPLSLDQQRSVVEAVCDHLLTPYGLRTLAPDDPAFQGRYEGNLFQRDSAYHQGTVWPWLIGPYCEAVLRVNGFSELARQEVQQTLQSLIQELNHGCVGQIAEVYDGDPPHRASGCPAQAWSVAEVLRAWMLAQGTKVLSPSRTETSISGSVS